MYALAGFVLGIISGTAFGFLLVGILWLGGHQSFDILHLIPAGGALAGTFFGGLYGCDKEARVMFASLTSEKN